MFADMQSLHTSSNFGPSIAANKDVDVLRSKRAACAASLIIRARAVVVFARLKLARAAPFSVSRAAFSWGAFAANSRLPALYDDASAVSAGLTRGHAVVAKDPRTGWCT